MSEGDDPLRGWTGLGCVTYLLLGTIYCAGNAFVWFLGPCPAFSSSTVCDWSTAYELWLFPLSQLAFLTIGIGLMLWVKRRGAR
jgi:hypothetical protein